MDACRFYPMCVATCAARTVWNMYSPLALIAVHKAVSGLLQSLVNCHHMSDYFRCCFRAHKQVHVHWTWLVAMPVLCNLLCTVENKFRRSLDINKTCFPNLWHCHFAHQVCSNFEDWASNSLYSKVCYSIYNVLRIEFSHYSVYLIQGRYLISNMFKALFHSPFRSSPLHATIRLLNISNARARV